TPSWICRVWPRRGPHAWFGDRTVDRSTRDHHPLHRRRCSGEPCRGDNCLAAYGHCCGGSLTAPRASPLGRCEVTMIPPSLCCWPAPVIGELALSAGGGSPSRWATRRPGCGGGLLLVS